MGYLRRTAVPRGGCAREFRGHVAGTQGIGDITRALEAVAGEGTTVRFEAGELVTGGPGDENGGTE